MTLKHSVTVYCKSFEEEDKVWIWISNNFIPSEYHIDIWWTTRNGIGYTRKYYFKYKRDAVLFQLTFG